MVLGEPTLVGIVRLTGTDLKNLHSRTLRLRVGAVQASRRSESQLSLSPPALSPCQRRSVAHFEGVWYDANALNRSFGDVEQFGGLFIRNRFQMGQLAHLV